LPKKQKKNLPNKPGVYLFKDKNGVVLYVGKAKNLRKRVASYFSKSQEIKTAILLSKVVNIDYIIAGSELDALILEEELIKKYKPRYNISLKDDKTYPYIKLTINEEWPRLLMVRKKQKDGALYFGKLRGGMVREVLRLAKRIFPIRWCKETPLKMRQQPCLYYHIGSCTGPCIGKINKKDYHALVESIILFLKGKMDKATTKLQQEMQKASDAQDYERAAYLRDRIKTLEKIIEGKKLKKEPAPRKIVEIKELKKVLKLKVDPMRIEVFDISNIQGSHIVASMVVFYGGLPLKNDYRRFQIRGVKGKANDVASIKEVIQRRYSGKLSKQLDLPDLILIDGGKPQLSAAAQGLKKKIPLISLAKKQEEIFTLNQKNSIKLTRQSDALKLLQRMRDEAHRFAITYHRLKRRKANLV